MENKQSPSNKKLKSIQEDKLMSVDAHDCYSENSARISKKLTLNLEIPKNHKHPSQKVLVCVKQRTPAIKTIYIAERSRRKEKRGSEKSQSHSRLGIGDHSSFNTLLTEDDSSVLSSSTCIRDQKQNSNVDSEPQYSSTVVTRDIRTDSKCSETAESKSNFYCDRKRADKKCDIYTQPQLITFNPTTEHKENLKAPTSRKPDIGVFILNPTPEESDAIPLSAVKSLYQRIETLERKIQRQEMVFRALEPSLNLSSSDEECKESKRQPVSGGAARPGCSYFQQYSHVPEHSAFQRYAQQASPLSPSKAATIDKEHNSEQYGRDFTTYDGLTARGRRQCASVTGKNEAPKMAADRVNKIRHKLNPIRDYRLMDTVHYLAQGEFAPRNDGIKLTPSREAVLSDIIWEDVCRTHWPNTRLGRRGAERCNTRPELQRLIDSLLRERVTNVERRRRRHYRIVKLNHRHENCRPVGKTGDIIVASHKNKETNEDKDVSISEHNASSAVLTNRRRWEDSAGRRHRIHNRPDYLERQNRHHLRQEDSVAGPSYAAKHPPTCCYHTSGPGKRRDMQQQTIMPVRATHNFSSSSSSSSRNQLKPRLLVKKKIPRKKDREESNLEHLILLPTLVSRTPSNVRRQKKFNELYHRILTSQLRNGQNCAVGAEAVERPSQSNADKRNIGLNINITLSESEEQIENSKRSK